MLSVRLNFPELRRSRIGRVDSNLSVEENAQLIAKTFDFLEEEGKLCLFVPAEGGTANGIEMKPEAKLGDYDVAKTGDVNICFVKSPDPSLELNAANKVKNEMKAATQFRRFLTYPIFISAFYDRYEKMRKLIIQEVNLDTLNVCEQTVLHVAAIAGNFKIICLLLSRNVDVNAMDFFGNTPLHYACYRNHFAVVARLLDHGADAGIANDDGAVPSYVCDLSTRRAFLPHSERYPNDLLVNEISDENGNTPLHLASSSGKLKAVRKLLKKGASPNCSNYDSRTPLHFAAKNKDARVAILLIESGAYINAQDEDGFTPLHRASHAGRESVVQALLEYGADFSILENDGLTAMTMSTNKKVRALLDNARSSSTAETKSKVIKNYLLGKVLGSGAFAKVKVGTHIETKQEYAVKVVSKDKIDKDDLDRLYKEIFITSVLDHPNIVRINEHFETKNNVYIIMENVKGGDLFDYIIANNPLDEESVRSLFRQMVEVVSFCHMFGIVHRDLKPENILLTEDYKKIKVIDFGLSNVRRELIFRTACGSPNYVAPEVLTEEFYDSKVDIWSLGIILHAMLFGMLPFDPDIVDVCTTPDLEEHIDFDYDLGRSEGCFSLIKRMLVKDPTKRCDFDEVRSHPWVGLPKQKPLAYPSVSNIKQSIVDDMKILGFKEKWIAESIELRENNCITQIYGLLVRRSKTKVKPERVETVMVGGQDYLQHRAVEKLRRGQTPTKDQGDPVETIFKVNRIDIDDEEEAESESVDEEEEEGERADGGMFSLLEFLRNAPKTAQEGQDSEKNEEEGDFDIPNASVAPAPLPVTLPPGMAKERSAETISPKKSGLLGRFKTKLKLGGVEKEKSKEDNAGMPPASYFAMRRKSLPTSMMPDFSSNSSLPAARNRFDAGLSLKSKQDFPKLSDDMPMAMFFSAIAQDKNLPASIYRQLIKTLQNYNIESVGDIRYSNAWRRVVQRDMEKTINEYLKVSFDESTSPRRRIMVSPFPKPQVPQTPRPLSSEGKPQVPQVPQVPRPSPLESKPQVPQVPKPQRYEGKMPVGRKRAPSGPRLKIVSSKVNLEQNKPKPDSADSESGAVSSPLDNYLKLAAKNAKTDRATGETNPKGEISGPIRRGPQVYTSAPNFAGGSVNNESLIEAEKRTQPKWKPTVPEKRPEVPNTGPGHGPPASYFSRRRASLPVAYIPDDTGSGSISPNDTRGSRSHKNSLLLSLDNLTTPDGFPLLSDSEPVERLFKAIANHRGQPPSTFNPLKKNLVEYNIDTVGDLRESDAWNYIIPSKLASLINEYLEKIKDPSRRTSPSMEKSPRNPSPGKDVNERLQVFPEAPTLPLSRGSGGKESI